MKREIERERETEGGRNTEREREVQKERERIGSNVSKEAIIVIRALVY